MKAQGVATALVVAVALVGCGGSKQLTNEKLATDLKTQIGSSSTLVCWTKTGKLGAMSAMGYTHVCGLSRNRPSLYVRTGVSGKPGWCLVTPRLNKAPRCPL
jgi:hypothetical protein